MLKPKVILVFLTSSLLFISCKQPETVIVTEDPSAPEQTTEPEDTFQRPPSFRQINIGEANRIPSLDPLFANNASTMRTLQLVYEGLVRFNGQGELVPAISKQWTVSPDSLTYRFTLNGNIYYHDSNIFDAGVGRRLVAGDVKFVFERMAWLTVPDRAAQLFMNIQGFESFYREQHNVLYPSERQLAGIKGIRVPNDSTVIFSLIHKDPNFLEKLATPLAVIYPEEAVDRNDPTAFRPVGTGPFTFSRKQGSRLTFSKFDNYHRPDEPILNRVDVIEITDSSDLVKHLKQQNLHFIPQPGPQLLAVILNANGELTNDLSNRFSLTRMQARIHHFLNYNSQSVLERAAARSLVQYADSSLFTEKLRGFVDFQMAEDRKTASAATVTDTINVTFTSDPFMKSFLRQLADTLAQENITLSMAEIRTPVRNTGLFTNTFIPLYSADSQPDTTNTLISFSSQYSALHLDSIRQLNFNHFPWWMNLRTVTLPGMDNLGQ